MPASSAVSVSAARPPLPEKADLDRFFSLSLDLMCVAGVDGYFRRVNPAWTRALGWSEAELLARPVADFMHPEDRERTLRARARLAKGIPVLGLENRYVCKDGSFRWLAWHSSIEREAGLVYAVARDITERRQSDHEHLVLSKLQSTGLLAGGIAHDFNNLLTSLLLNLEMVPLSGATNTQQGQHLRQAQETVRAAQALTQQLVTFAQGGGAARRTIDARSLLRQSFELALSGSSLRAECELASDLRSVDVDETQLAQVVRNLALNAREAMAGGGGTVWLRAENATVEEAQAGDLAPGDYVSFSVTDEGAGIPPDALPRVFDPYFSTKQRGTQKGMGLGLTICHAILQKHGGQILIDSRPGVGTTVRCLLPAASTPAEVLGDSSPEPELELEPTAEPRRILVMDDEPWLREIMAQTLARLGYVAELAKDGDEAIFCFERALNAGRPFAAVLLDLTVRGGMGGREVVKVLRELDPGVRAVLMTGYNREATFHEHAAHGFQSALSKPFSMDSLRWVLAEVVDGADVGAEVAAAGCDSDDADYPHI